MAATTGVADLNRYSRGDEANEATRLLAAKTQLDVGYARRVLRQVSWERFRALAPVYGADPAVIACWAQDAVRRRFWRDVTLAPLFAAEAAFVAAAWIVRPWNAWILACAIIVLAAAAAVVAAERFGIRQVLITRMLRASFRAASLPEQYQEEMRAGIAEAAGTRDRNLVIFRDDFPFAGSGRPELSWHLTLDVTHGSLSAGGSRRKPARFTSTELHQKIIGALSQMKLRDVQVRERLFVNGRYVWDNPALGPNWDLSHRPPVHVDDAVLRQAAQQPTPDARAYICAEMPAWEGQLVTTLFVRAVEAGGSLYVGWHFLVLPPLSNLVPQIDKLYAESRTAQVSKAAGWGLLHAVPALLACPAALAAAGWQAARYRLGGNAQSRRIQRGQVFDFGAGRSIREEASGFTSPRYFIVHDQVMAIMVAQETLLQAIRDFLAGCGVDLAEFDGQAQVITYSTEKKYNAGSVATGIVVGDLPAR